jgi:dephospho-CoA kinase
VVTAPAEMQRARVFERPGMSEEKLAALTAKQLPDAEKRARADFIVDSGQGFAAARQQVREILAQVAKMPPKRN